jgi:hypothetical protein
MPQDRADQGPDRESLTAAGEIELSEIRKSLDILVSAAPESVDQPVASADSTQGDLLANFED